MKMTMKQLQNKAPAAFANSNPMSKRYVQVRTADVVSSLADVGYVPVEAGQDKPRRRDPLTVTHLVTMRHERDIGRNTGTVPQLNLINSHNGRTMFRIFAGFYRFICSNGLVVGHDIFRYEMRHAGEVIGEALQFALDVGDQLNGVSESIEQWRGIDLTTARQHNFARAASKLRYGPSADGYEPETILNTRREEDRGDDLWSVYNRVQENTTQGGISGRAASGRRIRSRALTAIQPNLAYNRELWNLAESYAIK